MKSPEPGKEAKFTVPLRYYFGQQKFKVRVKVVEVRKNCGRTDVQVEPVAGEGKAWVKNSSLED